MFKHVPNILTIIRFLLIPMLIIVALQGNYIATIIVLTVSGITDILDGYIARRFNYITDFGKLMDPLADKATQITLLAVLTIQKIIPTWIIVIVLLKEFFMIDGASFLYGKELVVSSKWYGKLATVLFYIAIICSLFVQYWNGPLLSHPEYSLPMLPQFDTYIYYLAVFTTIFSLIMYVKAFYLQGYLKKAIGQDNKKTGA